MKKTTWFPTVFTLASIFAFIFVISTLYFLRSSILLQVVFPGYFNSPVSSGQTILEQRREQGSTDDPLITTVPTDQQTTNRKTKVFVSNIDPILGYASAKVFVILFGDPTDPVVQAYMPMFKELHDQWGDDVAFVWKDGTTVPTSATIQALAHCSGEQDRFWEFMQAYAAAPTTDETALYDIARSVGVEPITAKECVSSGEYHGLVTQETNYGVSLGVTTTHAIFINDALYNDPLSQEDLRNKVETILYE